MTEERQSFSSAERPKPVELLKFIAVVVAGCIGVATIESNRLAQLDQNTPKRVVLREAILVDYNDGLAFVSADGGVNPLPPGTELVPGSKWGAVVLQDGRIQSAVLLRGAQGSVCWAITPANESLVYTSRGGTLSPQLSGRFDLNNNCGPNK
jgi:hypothetical protein